MPEPRSGSG
jgi:hypothetical protein